MRTNIVLIDFESVQPASIAALEEDHYRVMVFVGATQAKLPFDVVSAIQRMGDRAEYVKLSGAGPNALDFHIAYYIGKLAAQEPTAFFHVISKDTGFDPLIRHLMTQHIFAARSATIDDIPLVKAASNQPAAERARVFVEQLRQPKSTKPRTDKTLSRSIATFFLKQKLTDEDVAAVVASMQKSGQVRVVDGKVAYSLGV